MERAQVSTVGLSSSDGGGPGSVPDQAKGTLSTPREKSDKIRCILERRVKEWKDAGRK